jgi:hypothetical protein
VAHYQNFYAESPVVGFFVCAQAYAALPTDASLFPPIVDEYPAMVMLITMVLAMALESGDGVREWRWW